MDLLYITVFKFGNWNSKDLIDYLHKENSLWHKSVKEHNLEECFAKGNRITNYSIEFSELLKDDPKRKKKADKAMETMGNKPGTNNNQNRNSNPNRRMN